MEIRALIRPEHRGQASRYVAGAVAALSAVDRWLGPSARTAFTLVDPPWHSPAITDPEITVLERTPWWSSPTSMAPELTAARAISSSRWRDAIDFSALPSWFTAGLIEYTARRAVTPVFQGQNLSPGYAMFEGRYFGSFVPKFVRIRLLPDADGEPLETYRARPRVNPAAPNSPAEERSLEGKTVLTIATFERWVGQPVFDGSMAEFVKTSRGRRPTLADFARVASASTGQNLSWLFDPAFSESVTFDYAVARFSSVPDPAGGFDTTVELERLSDGAFPGSSAPRVGPFESGRGVIVAIAFEDGERVIDAWDGRDSRKKFSYRSAARGISAVVDPDRTMLLDVNRTNNSRMLQSRTGPADTRWAARWMLWLEHALLGYGALV